MNFFELNKVTGAVVLAGLVAMLSGFTADKMMHSAPLSENAYKIEGVVEAVAGTTGENHQVPAADAAVTPASAAAPAALEPVSPLLAGADVAKGQASARVCAACHDFTKGGPNKVGPNLWGIVGNHRAHMDGYAYSAAMKGQNGESWDYETLNAYLANPRAVVPGTKMAFAGLKNVQDRANVIAWLRTLADTPKPLP